MKKTILALLLVLIAPVIFLRAAVAPSSGAASEHPVASPASVDIYGASVGFFLRPGDLVTVRTSAGVLCGSCVVSNPGFYGLLHVYGDDPTTAEVDGALPGESLRIEVNGEPVVPAGSAPTWTRDGDRQRVNITKRKP